MVSQRIGLISDVHASPRELEAALALFQQHEVTKILCAGDVAGYFDEVGETVELMQAANCDCVLGNHDVKYLSGTEQDETVSSYLSNLPLFLEYDIAGSHLYLVHAEPPDKMHGGIKLLNLDGELIPERRQQWQSKLANLEADILVVGHTHQVYAETVGDLLVINPGSLAFNHSCMILDLPEKTVQRFAVGGEHIVPCWNFSMQFGGRWPTR